MAESELVLRRCWRRRIGPSLLLAREVRVRDTLDVLPDDVPVHGVPRTARRHRGLPCPPRRTASGHRPEDADLRLDRSLGHLQETDRCTLLLAEGITNVTKGSLFTTPPPSGWTC